MNLATTLHLLESLAGFAGSLWLLGKASGYVLHALLDASAYKARTGVPDRLTGGCAAHDWQGVTR